ncbi:hypothetical protein WJX81_000288 [Elliptochloris bilobata]|uniref:Uncharacterized protein n=1 Tax=Elliptochloris bilobata TaxID=381761 RepID=A0AAW1RN52_9CHLO
MALAGLGGAMPPGAAEPSKQTLQQQLAAAASAAQQVPPPAPPPGPSAPSANVASDAFDAARLGLNGLPPRGSAGLAPVQGTAFRPPTPVNPGPALPGGAAQQTHGLFKPQDPAGSVNGRNTMQQFLYKPGNAAVLGGGPGAVPGARGVSPSNAAPPEFSNFAENALAAMSRVSSGSGAGMPAPQPPVQQKMQYGGQIIGQPPQLQQINRGNPPMPLHPAVVPNRGMLNQHQQHGLGGGLGAGGLSGSPLTNGLQGQVSGAQFTNLLYGGAGGGMGGALGGAGGPMNPNLGPNLGMGLGGQYAGARGNVGSGLNAWPGAPRPALPAGGGFGSVGGYNAHLAQAAQAQQRLMAATRANQVAAQAQVHAQAQAQHNLSLQNLAAVSGYTQQQLQGITPAQLQGLLSSLQLAAPPQPRPPPPFPHFVNSGDLAPPTPRPFAPPPPQRPSPIPSLQQQQAAQMYAAQAAQAQAQAQQAARGVINAGGAAALLGAPGRTPAYDTNTATRQQLLAHLNASGAVATLGAGSTRQSFIELGGQLARTGISVELAVNSGLLGGASAADVRSVTEGFKQESSHIRGEHDAQLAQEAANQARAQQAQSNAHHMQLLRNAQIQAAVAAAAQDAQAPAPAPSPGVQLGGQTSFGQLFEWPSALSAPPASEAVGQPGQAPYTSAPLALPPGSQWDPQVQRPASLGLGAFPGTSAAPASLPPGPFSRPSSTLGGEDAPPSVFAPAGGGGGSGGGLLGCGPSAGGYSSGLGAAPPSAGSAASLDGLGTVMRARSPWTNAEDTRRAAAMGSRPGSGLGSTPRSGMGGGFLEAGRMGAFGGGLSTGLSGQLSRQLSSSDGLGAWDLGGAGACQRLGQAGSKFGSQGSEGAEVPASVRAHWEGAGLLAPSRTSRASSVGLAPGGPSAAGAALKAQSLDGGLSYLGGVGAAPQPPAAPAAQAAADPSADAFNAASYSFFDSAPTSGGEVLEELEPGKSSIDADITREAAVEPEEEANASPAWA